MTNLNKNLQGMFAEFLNQFGKQNSSYNVLDRQIVLYTGDTLERKFEDQNPKGKGVDFDTPNDKNIGHCGTYFEDVDTDDDYILVDNNTPDIPRKRLRRAATVFRSPYTSNFGSSAKIKAIVREIRISTYALSDELNAVAINDVVDFKE
ncbi:hypothetical protein Fot_38520 [Forsythia ovata]|uniref:Uncharacterized protein n=1 Tax=Forsythia ovata TaxID=205694 RepID=A0ABD1S213_9LAMI